MDTYISQAEETVSFLENRWENPPEIVITLGTGLGLLPSEFKLLDRLNYSEIPNFPKSTVESHQGCLSYGECAGKPIAFLQGRFHYYEGYSTRRIAFPVRVLSLLGTQTLITTNASGGLNKLFPAGALMVIKDHIYLIPENPLRGQLPEYWGPRFPDMSQAYSSKLIEIADECAKDIGITLFKGVYVAIPGPSLETPAETKYLIQSGADAVGMSTVPEVIVAKHAGMEILGLSVIANCNDPDDMQPILIKDVIAQVKKAEKQLTGLLTGLIQKI